MGGGRRRWVREPALRRRRVPLARLFELANAVSLERPARLTLGDRDVRVRAVGTRARGGSVGAPSAKLFAQEPLAIGGSRRGLRLPRRRPDRGEAADGRIGIRVVPSEHRPGLGHRRVRFYDVWRRRCPSVSYAWLAAQLRYLPPHSSSATNPVHHPHNPTSVDMLRRLVTSVGAAAVRQARGPVNPAPVASRSVGGLMVVRPPRRPHQETKPLNPLV